VCDRVDNNICRMLIDVKVSEYTISLKAAGETVTAEKCADILMDNFLLENDDVVFVFVGKDGI
jgi:23S rRNA pseudoU1915 N3-methylase RlmH